ncbi:MAG: hypothetical protein RJB66_1270 [Pseudomonadota bacterium]|jgi:DNA-binding response OmpR family regulator
MEQTKILVVEDESIIAKDLQNILIEAGYDVPYTAANSKDALKYTEELNPDLILMDVIIQGPVDGITTAQIISHVYEIPIIFISAYSDKATLDRARSIGSFGYILKPCDEKELLITIDFGLQKARMDKLIKAQNRLLSSVLSNLETGAVVINEKGQIEFINPPVQQVLGWKDSELLKKSISELIPNYNQITNQSVEEYQGQFLTKNSGLMDLKFKLQLLTDNNNLPTGKLIQFSFEAKQKATKAS